MTDKEIKLRQIVEDFESHKISGPVAIELIENLTGEAIDIDYLSEYWASEDLDTFVEKLLIEHITDWQVIDDKRAIALIIEIRENAGKEGVVLRNSTALEKRYGKPFGTVAGKIFKSGSQDAKLIFDELKKDTRFLM